MTAWPSLRVCRSDPVRPPPFRRACLKSVGNVYSTCNNDAPTYVEMRGCSVRPEPEAAPGGVFFFMSLIRSRRAAIARENPDRRDRGARVALASGTWQGGDQRFALASVGGVHADTADAGRADGELRPARRAADLRSDTLSLFPRSARNQGSADQTWFRERPGRRAHHGERNDVDLDCRELAQIERGGRGRVARALLFHNALQPAPIGNRRQRDAARTRRLRNLRAAGRSRPAAGSGVVDHQSGLQHRRLLARTKL